MLRSKLVNQLFKQLYKEPIKSDFIDRVARTFNSTFAIGGFKCSTDNLVVAESFVLRIKFSGKNPAHRKSAKRFNPF